jgi:hypothetical protein
MKNDYLLEMLDELNDLGFDYTIKNGWFETTLSKNMHINFHISDEKETIAMMNILWEW